VGKATAAVVVTPYTVTYDGNAQTATVTSITGVCGETGGTVGTVSVSGTTHTNANNGVPYNDTWTFTPTVNYNTITTGNTITDTINKATPTFSNLTGSQTVSCGTASISLAGQLSAGAGPTQVSPVGQMATIKINGVNTTSTGFTGKAGNFSATVDTSALPAGTYTITYHYGDDGANFNAAPDDASTKLTVNNCNVETTTSVTSSKNASTYGDNVMFTATVTATSGSNPPAGTVQFVIDGSNFGAPVGLGACSPSTTTTACAPVSTAGLHASGSPHSVHAIYTHTGNFTDSTGDLSPGQTVQPKTLTALIIGNPTRLYNCGMTATLTLSNFQLNDLVGTESFTVNQTAGTYDSKDVLAAMTVTASLAPGNFSPVGATQASDYNLPTTASGPGHITPADASISVTPYTSATTKYDCNYHMATGTATGCDGDLNALFNFSGTSHKDAGDYPTDSWTFNAGHTNPNYNSASSIIDDSIAKADVTFNVSGYSVTYNCLEHKATGTVHINAVAAHTDTVYYNDSTGNYNNSSTTVTDEIKKANAIINITSYNVTYDYNSHTATGTATGVCGGENLLSLGDTLDLTGTTHTLPGDYNDPWSFTDVTGNYNNASGTLDTLSLPHDIIHYGDCLSPWGPNGVIFQPINVDGSSVFKQGSTVPVKFTVCDASGAPISNAAAVFGPANTTLVMLSKVRGTINPVNETMDTIDVPTTAWRFSSGQWIFNLATKNLQAGYTYYFRINLLYGEIDFHFGVK
jgi:hypothetical protein